MIDLNSNYKSEDCKKFADKLKNDYNLKLFIGKDTICNIINSLDNVEFIINGRASHYPEINGCLKHHKGIYKNNCIDCGLIFSNTNLKNKCHNCFHNPSFPEKQIAKVKNNELYFDKICPMQMSNYDLSDNKFIKNIANNKILNNILKEYFKCEYELCDIGKHSIFHNENNNTINKFFKQMFHVDEILQMYWKMGKPHKLRNNRKNHIFIKVFIPLCDVNEDNGALTVVKNSVFPNSEKVIEYDSARFTDDFVEKKYNKSDIISMNANMGELYIVRTDGLHKGGYIKGHGKRTVLYLKFQNKL